MVDLAVATIEGCDDAGVTVIKESEFHTPAATGEVPRQVDQIQYSTGQGPCLDAIREHRVFVTADLLAEQRWPLFAARTVAETGVRSMLSFRLFLEQDTLGSRNLYSKQRDAFGRDSQAVGEVFASHAALAMSAAQQHERVQAMTEDLKLSRLQSRTHARQAELAVALQRGMLTELSDLGPLQVAARYLPATDAAEIGGDWYDAFWLPDGAVKLTVGDWAGHDLGAAVAMGQARSVLRSLSVDRPEPPGQLLDRFDTVLSQLLPGRTGTCVCARLTQHDGQWQALFGNAGHLPPLLITDGAAQYVTLPEELLLAQASTSSDKSPGCCCHPVPRCCSTPTVSLNGGTATSTTAWPTSRPPRTHWPPHPLRNSPTSSLPASPRTPLTTCASSPSTYPNRPFTGCTGTGDLVR